MAGNHRNITEMCVSLEKSPGKFLSGVQGTTGSVLVEASNCGKRHNFSPFIYSFRM